MVRFDSSGLLVPISKTPECCSVATGMDYVISIELWEPSCDS
jgi:hypothetical protein